MATEAPQTYKLPSRLEGRGTRSAETFLELTDHVLAGGLNQNWIYSNGTERYVLRIPRPAHERQTTLSALQEEYDGIGAARNGVTFRIRTIAEQIDFIDRLQQTNRKSVDYLDAQGDTMLLPFVEGTPLHLHLQDKKTDLAVVDNVLQHLLESHKTGVVFGDRWGPNTIIKPNGDFVELDYDIELLGAQQDVATFELAQFLYHTVHFSGDRAHVTVARMKDFFAKDPSLLMDYDQDKLKTFLLGHAEYFYEKYVDHGELYEGLPPKHKEIFDLIDAIIPGDSSRPSRIAQTTPTFTPTNFAA